MLFHPLSLAKDNHRIKLISLSSMNALKTSLTLVGGISEANVSHPLSFALAKDNQF